MQYDSSNTVTPQILLWLSKSMKHFSKSLKKNLKTTPCGNMDGASGYFTVIQYEEILLVQGNQTFQAKKVTGVALTIDCCTRCDQTSSCKHHGVNFTAHLVQQMEFITSSSTHANC